MRKFKYYEPVYLGHGDVRHDEIIVTEKDILRDYWPYWKTRMEEAGKADLIDFNTCIEDFVIVNWAEEVKE